MRALPRRQLLARGLLAGGWVAGGAALAHTWGCQGERSRRRADPDVDDLAASEGPWAAALAALEPVSLPPAPGEEAFADRRRRAQERLTSLGQGALLVVASPNLRHLTGARWWLSERLFGMLLPASGEPIWICPAFEEARASERIPRGHEVRLWQEHEDPFALVARTLADQGVAASPIAVDPACPMAFTSRLSAASPGTTFVDGGPVTSWLRARKDRAELDAMRAANAITRQAIRLALEHLEEGMTGSVLGPRVAEAQQRLGGQSPWVLALIGEAAAYPHGTEVEPPLQLGDGVLIDSGCQVHGYWSDLSRTVFYGNPTVEGEKAWQAVKRAQQAALVAARPGVTAGDVDGAARRVLEAEGYGPGYRAFTHRLGHGIGLDVHEEPYLVQASEVVLEPGMTASDEPGVYLPGRLGVRLEDVLLVTEDGAELLSEAQTSPDVEGV